MKKSNIKIELTKEECKGLENDEIELAIARKLELLIIPHIRRNLDFFYGGANIPKKSRAYHHNISGEELEKALRGERQAVPTSCKKLCEMVVEILKDNGLDAQTVSCDTDMFGHTDVLLTASSGTQYIINYLEDAENIQSKMSTPDFASKGYYERRYKKFEGRQTTDGKSLNKIGFVSEDSMDRIDTNLGYKKHGMYMDAVIEQIRREFADFRNIMAENEYINEEYQMSKTGELTEEQKEKLKKTIKQKYSDFSDDEILEQKLDWLFDYFNERMDIKGHTDFVMYYSRLLLKGVLAKEEYEKLTRYDCFIKRDKITPDCIIKDVLDLENEENRQKVRFCMVGLGEKAYVFSTKPECYKKISKEEREDLEKEAQCIESKKPSDLMLVLCDRGNALPLVFHPIGASMLEQFAEENKNIPAKTLSAKIITTDKPVTSIKIPFKNGTKTIYIDANKEFAVQDSQGRIKIHHFDEQEERFKVQEAEEVGLC